MNNVYTFTAETAANIDRSTDIPRLEEIVRDCTRAIRHSRRTLKYSTATARTEAAAKSIAGYTSKMEAAQSRLTDLGC